MKPLTIQAHVLAGYNIKYLKTIGHDSCGTDLIPLHIFRTILVFKTPDLC